MANLSETAKSLLVLLNNANDLIIKASDRKNSDEVMKAIEIFAQNKNFPMPKEKLDNFHAILIDARPYTLTHLIKDIAEDIVVADRKINKPNTNIYKLKK